MFYLFLVVVYSYAGYAHLRDFFIEYPVLMAVDSLIMIAGIAIGFYFMRAESTGEKGMFAMARIYKDLDEDGRCIFMGKFEAARGSLFSSGILSSIVLGMAASQGLLERAPSVPQSYLLTLVLPLPILVIMLIDVFLRLSLKLAAGRGSGMVLKTDEKLNWLGFGLLGCFVSIWAYPYNDPDTGVLVPLAFVCAPIFGMAWRFFRSHGTKNEDSNLAGGISQ